MLGVRLEPELDGRLEQLAQQTGRSKSFYAREAIRYYLDTVGMTQQDADKIVQALKEEAFDYQFHAQDEAEWKD